MEPKIVDKEEIILVGFSFFGDPFAESGGWTEGNEIGRLWSRFEAYLAAHPDRIKHLKSRTEALEVHVETEETAARGHREVFVGVEVDELEDVPVEVLVKVLPPARYAVFSLVGEQITSDWSKIMDEWMTGEHDKAVKYVYRFVDDDHMIFEMHDLGIVPGETMVIEVNYERVKK